MKIPSYNTESKKLLITQHKTLWQKLYRSNDDEYQDLLLTIEYYDSLRFQPILNFSRKTNVKRYIFFSLILLIGVLCIPRKSIGQHIYESEPTSREEYSLSLYSDSRWAGLKPFYSEGLWGFKDKNGKVIASPIYDAIKEPKYSYAPLATSIIVKKGGKWGVIDNMGKEYAPFKYNSIVFFQSGGQGNFPDNVLVEKKNKWGLFKLGEELIFPVQYDSIARGAIYPNWVKVQEKGKYGYIDYVSKAVPIPLIYDEIHTPKGKLIKAKKDNRWGVIDRQKKIIIPFKYDDVDMEFYRYTTKVMFNGKWGVIDTSGNELFPIKYDFIDSYSYVRKHAKVQNDGKWGYVDPSGKELVPIKFDKVTSVQRQRYVGIKLGDKWGIMEISGKTLIPPKYHDIGSGLQKRKYITLPPTRVKLDDKYGFVDSTGKEIVAPIYDKVHPRFENFFTVQLDNKWALLDNQGNELTPLKYDEIKSPNPHVFLCKIENKWGVVNGEGKEIVPFIYQNMMSYDSTIIVSLNDRWGILNRKGNEIAPLIYSRVMLMRSSIAVCLGEKWGVLDYQGKELLSPSLAYEDMGPYAERLAQVDRNIQLFRLGSFRADSLKQDAFVNLSDENLFYYKYLDTEGQEEEYYDEGEDENEENQSKDMPKGERRSKFLKKLGFLPKDSIYIYNMFLDKVFTFSVKKAALIEKPSTYDGSEIGFKIPNLPLKSMGYFQWNSFVCVGDRNPFKTGNIHQIKWQEVDSTLFPQNLKSRKTYQGKAYQFKTDEYTYLLQNLGNSDLQPSGRHLLVFENNTNSLVFKHIYTDTESTDLSGLTNKKESYQWTGQIFKGKPPIIFGFQWFSFGCPSVDFIGSEEHPIEILCDNRH